MEGNLFKHYFLSVGIQATDEWKRAVGEPPLLFQHFKATVEDRYLALTQATAPNEATTEQELIRPVLEALGWHDYLPQQGTSRNEDIPDLLLFADPHAKQAAVQGGASEALRNAIVVAESKRLHRSLDAWVGQSGTPARQIRRYLTTADIETDGALRWGILTNGRIWRLYDQRARPRESGFFEVDLGEILESNTDDKLRVFQLLFGRASFLRADGATLSFLEVALEEGTRYGERVADDLSGVVFEVFSKLVTELADDSDADLNEVREAALIFLYRLLFVFYAEDRGLLPVNEPAYEGYGLRKRVRDDIAARIASGQRFSAIATNYHDHLATLFRMVDEGDESIGLPPYNGGLFAQNSAPLLARSRISDAVVAPIIHQLSHRPEDNGSTRFVNYRDLSVQQLGSIYERLLEREPVRETDGTVTVRLNPYSRKQSGSFYTPKELVDLVVETTLGPLVEERIRTFAARADELASLKRPNAERTRRLQKVDAAAAVLDIKVVDPAMGSGHFLVTAVDFLSGRIADLIDHPPIPPDGWLSSYESPLVARVAKIRAAILERAQQAGWRVDEPHLNEQAIIRRLVLKRCIYGVDKNDMAVELTKVSLWLHSFTVGAPLSFLDHHLRQGDSLFGLRVSQALDDLQRLGGLFAASAIQGAETASAAMQQIEENSDADIAEVRESATLFDGMEVTTAELRSLLSFLCGHRWITAGLKVKAREEAEAPLKRFLAPNAANAYQLLSGGPDDAVTQGDDSSHFRSIWRMCQDVAKRERFLHWEAAFPGVWQQWQSKRSAGGFDAVIGNPPWDRMKLQQVEWFAARHKEIASARRASDRKRMITELERAGGPLAAEFVAASGRAAAAMKTARAYGDYPYLSAGDTNLYSLFVERAFSLLQPNGVVGLLTPSGIASDKTASRFFRTIATEGRLRALYDFENRRARNRKSSLKGPAFFPDVHKSFKFSVLVAGRSPTGRPAECAFFLRDVSELEQPSRRFPLAASDFRHVNPNTGTAPVFRSRRDAELTTTIYERLPVLVDRSGESVAHAWSLQYRRMFDMTNDSGLFRTRRELEDNERAWPITGNRFDSPTGIWLPLYEGKMIQAFDHRAASVGVNLENQYRPAYPIPATPKQHADPDWLPSPQYWVSAADCGWHNETWTLCFKEITAPTNSRTFIAALCPVVGFGNKVPVLKPTSPERTEWLLAANFNSVIFDYVARQKVQGQTLNLFILEQLPVAPPDVYSNVEFGNKTATEVVRDAVLELTYTSNDMAAFARDLGYLDDNDNVKPPFQWNGERRLRLRAKLDAVFFHLYGVTDRDVIRYIYSTFPIVEREEIATYGHFRSRDLCLAYMNSLMSDPDAEVAL